jgi:AraC-like DNA-binding protein
MTEKDEYFLPVITYMVFRKCSPIWKLNKSVLRPCDITYIIQGNARYTINDVDYQVSAGDILCLPSETTRSAVTFPDSLMHCFSVNFWLYDFDDNVHKPRNLQLSSSLPLPVVSHLGVRKDLIKLFNTLASIWHDKLPGYISAATAQFLLIINLLLELQSYNIDSSDDELLIKKAKEYIEKHYPDNLSVKQIADKAGLNDIYFNTLFKRKTGVTLHQYLIKTRVRNAEKLLRSGECNVSKAAELCGYSDVIHFSRQFKAVMGFPPSLCLPKWSS